MKLSGRLTRKTPLKHEEPLFAWPVRCNAGFGQVEGRGVISTTPSGTTAIRKSWPASSRMPSRTSSPTVETSTGRQLPSQAVYRPSVASATRLAQLSLPIDIPHGFLVAPADLPGPLHALRLARNQ